jgi:uncharacterized membrane protein YheB (UPF0754 family)
MTSKTLLLLLLPFISAFIGWCTNRMALRMLFHPQLPTRFLGITFQGVFPKRQVQFAQKLGTVTGEFLNLKELTAQMSDPAAIAEIMPQLEAQIDEFLAVRIKEKIPVLAMFLTEGTSAMIKAGLMEEMEVMLPKLIQEYVQNLEKKIDIEKMVSEKVAAFSSDKLETLLRSVLAKELRFVEIMGGVLGFLIGLFQLVITQL